jgi:NADH-quinone oxidoreductase subunit L
MEEEPTVVFGEPVRAAKVDDSHPPHEAPPVMTLPVLALAGLAVIGGLLNIPLKGLEFLTDWLHPVFADVHEIHSPSFAKGSLLTGLSVVVALVGIAIAHALYRRGLESPDRDPAVERLGLAARVFGHAYYFDEGVGRLVGGPVRRLAAWLNDTFDARVVDGAVNGVGALVRRGGTGLRKVQSGLVRNYALWIVIGAAALLLFLLLYSGR